MTATALNCEAPVKTSNDIAHACQMEAPAATAPTPNNEREHSNGETESDRRSEHLPLAGLQHHCQVRHGRDGNAGSARFPICDQGALVNSAVNWLRRR